MQNKLCVIGVYFGRLPKYFPLWLKTAASNTHVDFYIFTDQQFEHHLPNVFRADMTLQAMKQRASRVLGFDAALTTPYKCCDYKIIYGLIFADYVQGYDYWAHTDFDMMYGDITFFAQQYELYKYDKFLPLGHLSFYRNTEESNHHFMKTIKNVTRDYREVFTQERCFGFDEGPHHGLIAIYMQNKLPFMKKKLYVDIDKFRYRYCQSPLCFEQETIVNYKHQVFYWEKGKVYQAWWDKGTISREEYIYIHFQHRPNYELTFDPADVDAFYITNQGFFPKSGEVTLEDIRTLNPYHGAMYEAIERKYKYVRLRCRNYLNAIQRKLKQLFDAQ